MWEQAAIIVVALVVIEGAVQILRRAQSKRIEKSVMGMEEKLEGRLGTVGRGLDESINRKMSTRRSEQEQLSAAMSELRNVKDELKLVATQWHEERFIALVSRIEMIEFQIALLRGGKIPPRPPERLEE